VDLHADADLDVQAPLRPPGVELVRNVSAFATSAYILMRTRGR
jgi:hypothetical protein